MYIYIHIHLGVIENVDINPNGEVSISSSMNMKKLLTKPFRVGQLFHDMKLLDIQSNIRDRNVFLNKVRTSKGGANFIYIFMNVYVYIYR
jgi:hypothetical protein